MPNPHRLAIAAAIFALFAIIGAASGGTAVLQYHTLPPSDPGAVNHLEQSTTAVQSVTAYTYTISGTISATEDARQQSITVGGTGAVNRTDRQLHVVVSGGEDEFSGGEDRDELFVDGYTRYTLCPLSRFGNVEDVWYGTSLDRKHPWWRYTALGNLDQVQRFSRAYDRGRATIDGTPTRVVVLRPNVNRVRALQAQLQPTSDDSEAERPRVKEMRVTLWLSTETHRPIRIRVRRVSRVGSLFRGVRVVEELTYEYTYEPTTVELPPQRVDRQGACPENP